MVGVAQLVRAPDCGSGGRGFETRHSPQRLRIRITRAGSQMTGGNKQVAPLAPRSSPAPVATTFQLRSFRRFSIQCSVYYSSDALQGTGVAWNLSLNGWRIDGTHPVEPGTVVTLCVFLPDQHPTVFIDRAVVRWSRGQEFGIEVNEIKADEHARLEQFVTALV